MRRFLATTAITLIVVSQTAYAQAPNFDGCGTLIQGVECILFDSDNYGVYVILGDLGGFGVGDRVRVTGFLPNTPCFTICMQVDGCIENATVSPCQIPTLSEWGMIIFALLLLAGIGVQLSRRRMAGAAA